MTHFQEVTASAVLGSEQAECLARLVQRSLPYEEAKRFMEAALPRITSDEAMILFVEEVFSRLMPDVPDEERQAALFRAGLLNTYHHQLVSQEAIRRIWDQLVLVDRESATLRQMFKRLAADARRSAERIRSGKFDFRMRVPLGFDAVAPECRWPPGTVVRARLLRADPDMTPLDAWVALRSGDGIFSPHTAGLKLLERNWPQPPAIGLPEQFTVAGIISPPRTDREIAPRPPCEVQVLEMPARRLSTIRVMPQHRIPAHHNLYVLGLARPEKSEAA